MLRRILLSGALGWVAVLLYTFVANVVFGFTNRVAMNRVPNERAVYAVLKENVVAPGAYIVNPEPAPGGPFPAGEPVFGLRFSGMGHEAAGRMFRVELALGFLPMLLAAGLLSVTSAQVLSRYFHKVLFIASIGLLLAVTGDLTKFGIGGYPASSALLLAANDVASWTLAGLVMAWAMRAPEEARGTP
jgi:hypothetical protein